MPAMNIPGKADNVAGSQILTPSASAVLRSAQLRIIVGLLVETIHGIGWSELTGPKRGPVQTIRIRHIAMYLTHIAGGLSLTATGILFERDRRTVAHAAALVEDRREHDRHLDLALDVMARSIALALSRSTAPQPASDGPPSANQGFDDV